MLGEVANNVQERKTGRYRSKIRIGMRESRSGVTITKNRLRKELKLL